MIKKKQTIVKGKRNITPKTKKQQQQLIDHQLDQELYSDSDDEYNQDDEGHDHFDIFSFKSEINKTSTQTLSNIKILESSQVAKILDTIPNKHIKEKKELIENAKHNNFYEMYNDLKMGHNLLLYGYGSKKQYIESFVQHPMFCSDGPFIPIFGYLPHFNIKSVLDCITNLLFKSKSPPFSSLMMQCEYIKLKFEEKEKEMKRQQLNDDIFNGAGVVKSPLKRKKRKESIDNNDNDQDESSSSSSSSSDEGGYDTEDFKSYDCLYLVIHNIDGVALRNIKTQTVLAYLAGIPQIHIIASVDHLNSPILWDINFEIQFNWIRHCIRTYEPYAIESAYEVSLLNTRGGGGGQGIGSSRTQSKSIVMVLKSLTPSARLIFQKMLTYLVDNDKEKKMSFIHLYDICVDAFLVSSQSMLKSMLSEFIDHGIIQSHVDHNEQYLSIPIVSTSFKQLLNEIKELN